MGVAAFVEVKLQLELQLVLVLVHHLDHYRSPPLPRLYLPSHRKLKGVHTTDAW